MLMIKKDGEIIGFAEDNSKVQDFLPNSPLQTFLMLRGNDRRLTYENAVYEILHTNKKKGIDIGDICPICEQGVVVDAGGCVTCNKCGAQLKCGL